MRKRKANPDFYRQGFKALFTRIMSLEDYGKLKESEKPKIVGRSTIADKQEFIVELTEDEIKDPTRMEKHVRGQLERETSSGKYLNPQTGKQLFCKGRLEALTDYENILFPEPHNLTHKGMK